MQEEDKGSKLTGMSGRRDIDLLSHVQPIDLIKFGFIPEFIGRLPVTAVLEDLDRSALIQILTKPKNAIVKQYQKLFEFENVRLRSPTMLSMRSRISPWNGKSERAGCA